MKNEGATVNPYAAAVVDSCPQLPSKGVPRTGQHRWIWHWEQDGHWSNKVRCTNCGEIRMNTPNDNSTIQPGVIHNAEQS